MPKGKRTLFSPYNALRLPNAGEKTQTPASLKIDLWYHQLNIYDRWTWERFQRLAEFLRVTPYELGSIVCITHKQVDHYRLRNKLMDGANQNRSAALVLTLLETFCCKAYTNDIVENIFPDLNTVSPCTH